MPSLPADIKIHLADLLRAALASVAPGTSAEIHLERPRDASHGDFASNLALQLARTLKQNPRQIAERLVRELPASPWLIKAEVAGAGFINLTVAPAAKTAVVAAVLAQGDDFGRGAKKPGKLQIEFVSANPTGPLHVGHGRGAAYGASLANLLAFSGHTVCREYYVNDAGRQMDILAVSTWLRYLDLFGERVAFPPNAYQGEYVRDMAGQIRTAHADRYVHPTAAVLACVPPAEAEPEAHLDGLIAAAKDLLGEEWHYIHQHVLAEQLADCREDLEAYGVHFDCWFSERSLYDTGMVAQAVGALEKRGHIYVQDGAKWFRSTHFGDEKDRVVQRENGLYTYFASDIAYHCNKLERGFTQLVDIWGADHHGYIPRVRGALQALELDDKVLDVALVQFVSLFRGTEKVSMSTRSGSYVTLRELREEVGNDACRFFYLLRKQDQSLDFDLDLAKSQSNDNPVYYVQYAHARVCSVLAQWGGEARTLAAADLALLASERELALAAKLAAFPELIDSAAHDYAPHAVAFWLRELAAEFHAWYNAERLLVDDAAQKQARLALAVAVRQVIRNGLRLLGVSAPDSM
ncbi:MAG: arginine--tRNA ligase [Gammaproteobacteria bacterium]|nr:arginine--tRNA ligase [Rhodocyclaceae bacterium]MBU3910174.1 arginine--tRNA ligase [Gammaproteobacteria bacterium]MBU3989183.1 arginine--tRNA ligase [Gammaproteobacteria bacterium]MBU4006181.1 arginine--tRNA ligase [Gammaproteobacteria bacterium]MBU4022636.1 arginine--tRNA ligase [Gammaproteobacteria bacterium]